MGAFLPSLVKNLALWFFKIVNVFSLFCYLYHLEIRPGAWFGQTRIPFTHGCFVPIFGLNGPCNSGKKVFKFWQCIFAISSVVKRSDFFFKQTGISLIQGCFASKLKLIQVFLRRRSLNVVKLFFALWLLSLSEKGHGPSYGKRQIRFKLTQLFCWSRWRLKDSWQTDRRTDKLRSEKLTEAFS